MSLLDSKTKEELIEIGKSLGQELLATGAAAATSMILDKVLVSNYEKKDVKGVDKYTLTDNEKSVQKNDTQANKNSASLGDDTVSAQKGNVDAAKQDADAAQQKAVAADTGAKALETKAGAMDVATKALKIN